MERLLEVIDVRKSFGGNRVLEGVSFSVKGGEILGIIGPNGSGKTTLLNVISGLIRQDSGKILLMGKDISDAKPHVRARLGMGRTFQNPRAFPSLIVLECLKIAQLHSGRDVQIDELLKKTGLYELQGRASDKLSLAQRKRLELAKALAIKPKVLLLDEIFAGLNPASIGEVSHLIKQLKDEGLGIVIVEHVLSALVPLADRLLVLAGGRVIYDGDKYEAFRDEKVRRAYLGERYSSLGV
ncbi:ABC transporter related protein [Hydrogenobacter thermophilus TK-6]|uniref:ABC-type branched-chain amino acid transporter ATPase component n=1 Tax=Hydrogenobacter thermophilus (strain DSM 6534 / IAM 12695 / TK-6) TaxID=608538 RepID=D3DGB4_HYDTT|nr:ABC transporter ATP-binding protein [Hydrogenobacter thermophilus]ADO44802.1 ABC transporter related protein [Hydrogenobacter thermophilus TK-6]BAI68866.1 ABC-type branched-chain amino acid transporter ATPase component [Hydrogenobacter thermophilus TK-6]